MSAIDAVFELADRYYGIDDRTKPNDVVLRGLKELEELREQASKYQWQPIKTAPEKTDILIAIKRNTNNWQVEQAEKISGCFYAIWGSDRSFEPTYWMPLPEPPEIK